MKSKHEDLTELAVVQGYDKSIKEGMCRGFGVAWLIASISSIRIEENHAVPLSDEGNIYNRIRLIRSYNRDFSKLYEDLQNFTKNQAHPIAIPSEEVMLSIQGWYNSMM